MSLKIIYAIVEYYVAYCIHVSLSDANKG